MRTDAPRKPRQNDMTTGAPKNHRTNIYENICSGKKPKTNFIRTDDPKNPEKKYIREQMLRKTQKQPI